MIGYPRRCRVCGKQRRITDFVVSRGQPTRRCRACEAQRRAGHTPWTPGGRGRIPLWAKRKEA